MQDIVYEYLMVISGLYIFLIQGLPRLSIEMLRRCVEWEPDSTSALHLLAQQFHSLQNAKAETDCLKQLVRVCVALSFLSMVRGLVL
jgi:hypothetical protein